MWVPFSGDVCLFDNIFKSYIFVSLSTCMLYEFTFFSRCKNHVPVWHLFVSSVWFYLMWLIVLLWSRYTHFHTEKQCQWKQYHKMQNLTLHLVKLFSLKKPLCMKSVYKIQKTTLDLANDLISSDWTSLYSIYIYCSYKNLSQDAINCLWSSY